MRLVATSDLQENTTLARDILTGRDAAPLLRAGVKLSARFIGHLQRAGILSVYVDDQYSEGIDAQPVISAQTRGVATRAVAAVYEEAKRCVASGRALEPDATDGLSDVVDQILLEIESLDGKAVVLADLCAADAYALQHPIDVTALGLLIGRRLIIEHGWLDYKGERQNNRHEERLFRLGMGLVLSDIGKLAIPDSILNKPGELSEEEWEIVKTHPKAGVKLVRDTGAWCPLVQACVLRHHERWNGAGYPEGKTATEIHEMARIAGTASCRKPRRSMMRAPSSAWRCMSAHSSPVRLAGLRRIASGIASLPMSWKSAAWPSRSSSASERPSSLPIASASCCTRREWPAV